MAASEELNLLEIYNAGIKLLNKSVECFEANYSEDLYNEINNSYSEVLTNNPDLTELQKTAVLFKWSFITSKCLTSGNYETDFATYDKLIWNYFNIYPILTLIEGYKKKDDEDNNDYNDRIDKIFADLLNE